MPIAGSPPPIYAPPTDPSVAAQQAGPMAQFMAQRQAAGPAGGNQDAAPPLQMVEQTLNQVALQLRDVARILLMSKPMLMPVLQKMIQAGAMLMDEIQKTNSGQGSQGTDGAPEDQSGGGGPDGGALPGAQ